MRWIAAIALPVLAFGQQSMGSAIKAQPRSSPKAASAIAPPPIDLRDVAAEWGIRAPNHYGGVAKKRHILEMTGNGVGLVDTDNDGNLDIVFVNGARFDTGSKPSILYRNLGNRRFAESPLPTSGWSQGVCAGDADNDGFTDLLVTAYGNSQFLRNDRGKFGAAPFPATPGVFNTGCAFLDYDRDGDLDVFVTSYVSFSLAAVTKAAAIEPCSWLGISVFCGPRGFDSSGNRLFRNEGGARFTDVSKTAGLAVQGARYGLGATAADFDADGWLDIYVACDSTPSILYRNNRDGTFTDVAVTAGVAYGENGQEQGGMGTATGDYYNDGKLDIVRTNFIDETATTLYRNQGGWFFSDETLASGMALNTKFVSWGVAWVDLDHNGWQDLVAANGHIYPELKAGYAMPPMIYYNGRNSAFRDVRHGLAAASSRGLAAGDLDNDGALEIVIVNQNAAPSVIQNRGPKGNWVRVALRGTNPVGATVRVKAGGITQTSTVHSGSSYLSQPDFRQHFGIGTSDRVDEIEVTWSNGKKQIVTDQPANREVTVTAR